jgi:hypothetical protein
LRGGFSVSEFDEVEDHDFCGVASGGVVWEGIAVSGFEEGIEVAGSEGGEL